MNRAARKGGIFQGEGWYFEGGGDTFQGGVVFWSGVWILRKGYDKSEGTINRDTGQLIETWRPYKRIGGTVWVARKLLRWYHLLRSVYNSGGLWFRTVNWNLKTIQNNWRYCMGARKPLRWYHLLRSVCNSGGLWFFWWVCVEGLLGACVGGGVTEVGGGKNTLLSC